ncbi:MAG TPA: magnesium-translocating P-type ATPase [Thermodesulfovibrionales bacterium]|nr:magnesium-translocating P-type ATPase [Thermodesulfovibrionales bacterium]
MLPYSSNQGSAFWQKDITTLLKELDAALVGLSESEASARLAAFGPNLLHPVRKRILLLQFLEKFRNPLVLILLVASVVLALTGDVTSFLIITVIVLISVTLDFIQEHRAGQAADRLRKSVAVHVQALRDGNPREIPVAELVPGDIILLAAGDLVPGDGRIIESRDFFVNQALLTGEPYPVEKTPGDMAEESDILAANNSVLLGTSVISGSAKVLVCRTGANTVLGDIADTLVAKPPPTAFEQGTRNFGLLIMRFTVLLVLFVLLVNAFFHRPWLESFLFAVALAVGLTPELLPMVVSVTLARGAQRMAAKKVIMKRLAAIQNLGSMDILCTDKTGTLTEARIRLERHVDCRGRDSKRVLELAYLNSYFETGLKSPLDDAILEHIEIDIAGWRKIDEVPFDFERRRVSVLVDNGQTRLLVVKGAPEDIVRLCTSCEEDSASSSPLDSTTLSSVQNLFERLGREGFRVLGVAWREVEADHPHAVVGDETGLVFAGFAAFLDPPKESARDALSRLAASGVSVKIVTGDNELVTEHICNELGLPIVGILTGAEIHQMDDQALSVQVERANLFCRVTPIQKNRVILALKKRGHAIGYLGDGINDAPSLHSADIGISVDSAVDVAKDAAEMILLEHDLGVLYEGVMEGRRTFGNVMKYIMMGTSSNFGNMFSMAGGSLFLPFIPMLPVQILLNNMLYDISEVPIPLDNVDEEYLIRPRQWDIGFVRKFMLAIGPVSSLFDFLTFFVMLGVFHAGEKLFHTGWFIESLATQVLVIFVIRTHKNPFRSRPHPLLTASSLIVVACAIALPFTPLAAYLGFEPLPPLFFLVLTGMVIIYLLIVEQVKQWFFNRYLSA